jgi:hypothetical protein
VSFALSFGSDHAGLLYSLPLPRPHSHPSCYDYGLMLCLPTHLLMPQIGLGSPST